MSRDPRYVFVVLGPTSDGTVGAIDVFVRREDADGVARFDPARRVQQVALNHGLVRR